MKKILILVVIMSMIGVACQTPRSSFATSFFDELRDNGLLAGGYTNNEFIDRIEKGIFVYSSLFENKYMAKPNISLENQDPRLKSDDLKLFLINWLSMPGQTYIFQTELSNYLKNEFKYIEPDKWKIP